MRRNSVFYISALLVLLTPAAALSMPWSWDMFTQESHKAQEEAAVPVPEGTVTTDGKPFHLKDRAEAVALQNPAPPESGSLEEGKRKYSIYCATCHGDTGVGDGPVGKKYITPTNLSSAYVHDKPDGDIYYTITYGGLAIMPGYGD